MKLRNTISSDKVRPGQIILAEIAQTVPLPNGTSIRAGGKVEGRILAASKGDGSVSARISFRFEKVHSKGVAIPVNISLRAVAGFMGVLSASVPEEGAAEGSPSNWWTTVQIGGDSVYGVGGPVMSGEHTSEEVGRSVSDGVLVRASAKKGTKCRGVVADNDRPQAFWVFSSDACGTYGMEQVRIAHAGRSEPVGTIVLTSEKPQLRLRGGDGLLLRVNAIPQE